MLDLTGNRVASCPGLVDGLHSLKTVIGVPVSDSEAVFSPFSHSLAFHRKIHYSSGPPAAGAECHRTRTRQRKRRARKVLLLLLVRAQDGTHQTVLDPHFLTACLSPPPLSFGPPLIFASSHSLLSLIRRLAAPPAHGQHDVLSAFAKRRLRSRFQLQPLAAREQNRDQNVRHKTPATTDCDRGDCGPIQ